MAWASAVDICNGALSLLGAERIIALEGTDSDNKRILCALFYEQARDAVLTDFPWNFAVRRTTLTAALASSDPNYPVFDWAYGFNLPADPYCLRVLRTYGNEPYEVNGRVLYCDSSSISIKFIARITAVSQYQPMAAQAIAAYLAMMLALPLTESTTKYTSMANLYESLKRRAEDTDTQEGTPDEIDSDELLTVRSGVTAY